MLSVKKILAVWFIWLGLSLVSLYGQIAMKANVTANGGGITTSANHQLSLTIGQTPVGELVGTEHSQRIGFWYIVQADLAVRVDEKPSGQTPDHNELQQNYPNPFNPTTTIVFSIAQEEPVRLLLYDAIGRVIATLVDQTMPAGNYQVTVDGSQLASGVYFYHLQTNGFTQSRKMMLLK